MQDRSTDFEFLPIDVNLGRCQRYAYQLGDIFLGKMRELDRARAGFYIFPVQMRATPTVPSLTTTATRSVTIGGLTTRGFDMECLASSDGETANIRSGLIVTAEL